MSRSTDFLAGLLGVALTLTAAAASARTSDRRQPMDIESARSTCATGGNASCTLTGDVTLVQGTLRVRADKAVIQQAGGNPSRALLSGNVSLQQEMDDGDRIDATSDNIDYDLRNEVMVFTGNVVIRQQRGTLNGQRVVYNLKTGQVESGGDGGRVKMRILPKEAPATTGKGML
ncbi:lipopolysaccharide transport periplasmic protein LptA [Thermomonas alba]|uniref:lipopolysaccharide transport periplasmic protein LptA n=1 Tax=Thermomonas alba TaxID=2888525 RepID=UPI001F0378D9|nr:lipopolysaccharide transport periplasmic protein LptA [Thermomonas alba]